MKKLRVFLLAALLALTLPGCSFTGFSVQNLMSPPKVNADQQNIYKLLQGTQPDVTFIYPRSGAYRSAIIMEDFTGDGVEDALGFHLLEETDTTGSIEVQFLTKVDGEWAALSSFTNIATQVDRVCFGSLGDGGGQSVLIGWGSTAGSTGRMATMNAYLYEDGEMREYTLGPYGEMTLTDFDGDGINEVFTIDKYVPAAEEAEASSAQARVYTFNTGKPEEADSAMADNSISTYSSVLFGQLSEEYQGVVVDGATADGSMNTQIFVLDQGRLRNYPVGVNSENYTNPFSRPSTAAFTSRDINGDGFIEVPAVTRLPGLPEDVSPDTTSYMVEWDTFRPRNGRKMSLYALMNVRENYWFQVPYRLRGRVSASNDAARRTVTYTEMVTAEDMSLLLGSPLFSIRVFTQSAWESRGEGSGYTMLAEQGDSVYGIQVLTQDEKLLLTIEEIKNSFQMITE